MGGANSLLGPPPNLGAMHSSAIMVHEIALHEVMTQYRTAETSKERLLAGEKLRQEVARQQWVDETYRIFAALTYPDALEKQQDLRRRRESPEQMRCEVDTHQAFVTYCAHRFDANSPFALSFHQVVVNVCSDVAKGLQLAVPGVAEMACKTTSEFMARQTTGQTTQIMV